jgi:fluoride exporter
MTPLLFLGVAAAGGVGAGLRYLVDIGLRRLVGERFPWGILAVNLSGAFMLGLVTAAVADAAGQWLLGVGLLGGYTTFSSVAVTTALLARDDRARAALGYALATFAGSVLAAVAGTAVGTLAA